MPGAVRPGIRWDMGTTSIALVGDYSAEVIAHQAIPRALELCSQVLNRSVVGTWVPTASLGDVAKDLSGYSALWVVPRSPYENMTGVLAAIRWARENKIPFVGTCGGFQHAMIEIARNVAHLPLADHAETNPVGTELVISALTCSLAETSGAVRFVEGSRIARAYGNLSAEEGYHCNYGINPAYRGRLEDAGLFFSAFDSKGAIRGAELAGHPFFVGTLFQPERLALRGLPPPLVTAFVRAASAR